MEQIEGQMSFADLRDDGIQVSNREAKKIMEIPADGSHVEIFGHRLDGDFKNFQGFCEYLHKLDRTESNWNTLKRYLEDHIKAYNKKFCSFAEVIETGGMKKVLEKMEELENGR